MAFSYYRSTPGSQTRDVEHTLILTESSDAWFPDLEIAKISHAWHVNPKERPYATVHMASLIGRKKCNLGKIQDFSTSIALRRAISPGPRLSLTGNWPSRIRSFLNQKVQVGVLISLRKGVERITAICILRHSQHT